MIEPSFVSLRTPVRSRQSAFAAAVILVAAGAAAALLGRQAGPQLPQVLPLLTGLVIATGLLTAYVMFLEFAYVRERWLAILATSYAFVALLAVAYLMMFPGVFSAAGLFGASPTSSLILWLVWHAAFPALALLTVLARRAGGTIAPQTVPRIVVAYLAGSIIVTVAATCAVSVFGSSLPPLVDQNRFSPLVSFVILPLLLLLGCVALMQLYVTSRMRTTLSLWQWLAVLCSMLDVLLGLSADRYSIAWDIGKVFMMLSSSVVLMAFLGDIVRLRQRLGDANADLQRSHETLAHFRALSESTRDIIMFMDRDSMEIVEANQAALDAFGFSREELIGSNLSIIQGTAGRIAASDESLERGLLFEREYWRKDGSSFPAEVFGRMTEVDGRRLYVSTTRDITERFTARAEVAPGPRPRDRSLALEERVRRDDESRDPHPDERDHRYDRSAVANAAGRRSARVCSDRARIRPLAAHHHQ